MSDRVISSTGSYTGYSAAVSVDAANDYMLIQQSGAYKKINRNVLLGVTGTPADLSTVQTFTNKVLDTTNTVTLLDTLFTLKDNSDPTKIAVFQLSGITTGTTRTYTLPNASSTLMDLATAQNVTGVKTMTSPVISGGSIDNTTITVDAIGEHTAANGVTIDGMNIKDGKLNTNNSVITASITDAAITPAKLIAGTGSGWPWASWVPTFTNFTLGNGTLTARYVQTGKTVNARMSIILGTTSAMTGDFQFTLPVTATALPSSANLDVIGMGNIYDAAAAIDLVQVALNSTTKGNIRGFLASGTYVSFSAFTATVPFVWATSMEIHVTFSYEAA